MKHLQSIPLCANTLFVYKLNIKKDLTLKFTEEKFRSVADPEVQGVLVTENLNILKKYKELNKEINKAIDLTIKEILMIKNINYRIFSSWVTKTKPKGFSASHFHWNSWLSGIYYPKNNPGFNIKFFYDNKIPFFTIPTEYNIYNSNHWVINPEDNFLILFFSQLRHKIMPNQSNEDRFSLSFNLLPKGEFGEADYKTIF